MEIYLLIYLEAKALENINLNEEEFDNEEELNNEEEFRDLFGDKNFAGDELLVDGLDDLFGDENFAGDELLSDELDDLFGNGELYSSNSSNFEEWLNCDGNPELINLEVTNPNDRIFFRVPNFDYDGSYDDLRFIFERFRAELLNDEL